MCRYHDRYQPLVDAATALCRSVAAGATPQADAVSALREGLHAALSLPDVDPRHYVIQWTWPGGESYRQSTVFLTDAEAGQIRHWLEHHRRFLNISDVQVRLAGTFAEPTTFVDLLAEWSTFFVATDQSGEERYLGELIASQTYFEAAAQSVPAIAAEQGRG
ncbi:MAG: hypothetical protein RLO06_15080 [Parvibaculum sp.]|jgi:hypothetical protein